MSDHVLDRIEGHLAGVHSALLRAAFRAERNDSEDGLVLRLRGELDMATAPQLHRTLDGALDAGRSKIVLDLGDLTFVDSSGIRVLLDANRRAQSQACSFVLRAPCRSVLKALRLTGVDRLVPIEAIPAWT